MLISPRILNFLVLFHSKEVQSFFAGVYKEQFATTIQSTAFFEHLSKDDNKTWKEEKKQDVMTYFNRSLLTYIGKPALKMLRFVLFYTKICLIDLTYGF